MWAQVCNHPELFERRDVRSPLALAVDDYHLPRLVAERGPLGSAPARRPLLRLSALAPAHVRASLAASRAGLFAWSRLADVSPAELHRVAQGGWLYASVHAFRALF